MSRKRSLKWEGLGVLFPFISRFGVVDFPDLGGMVRTACGQFLNVWGQQNASNVFFVRTEMGHRHDLCLIVSLL